jgi:hypothetical protein
VCPDDDEQSVMKRYDRHLPFGPDGQAKPKP